MQTPKNAEAYPHYYRPVPNASHVDVYRVCDMFGVRRSAVAHAVKKLLCSGIRGAKDELRDLREARDSIDRAIEMMGEECAR
jgi:hypothetical protein